MEHFQTYIHTGSLYKHIFFIDIVPLDKSALNIYTTFQTHVLGTQKKRLNETVILSAKLPVKTGEQNIFTILHSKLCSYRHNASVSKIER